MSGFNLPISKLEEKRFDINQIKEDYFSDDPFDVTNNLIYFPIALMSNTNYVTKKIDFRNLLRTYSYSQQFISDLNEILIMNELTYDLYFGDTKLNVIDGKITIPELEYDNLYTKVEIDEIVNRLDTKINQIDDTIENITQLRYSYKIQFYYTNNQYTVLINNQIVHGAIVETIVDGEIITKLTIKHPLNLGLLNNQFPNVTVLENKQINENLVNFNNCATNYILESFVNILIRKEVKVVNNELVVDLIFNNTRCFMGKIQIN